MLLVGFGPAIVRARQGSGTIVTLSNGTNRRIPDDVLPFVRVRPDEEEISPQQISKDRLGSLFDYAIAPRSNATIELSFGQVSGEVAEIVSRGTGLNIQGLFHTIDTNHIRHAMKRHGTQRVFAEGQVPLTREDFVAIVHIVSAPDRVEVVGKTKEGLDALRFLKRETIDRVYVAELRRGRGNISAKTQYNFQIEKGGLGLGVQKLRDTSPGAT